MTAVKRWRLKATPDPAVVAALTHARSPQSLATLLAQRGISTPEEASLFYRPTLGQLHDPFLMKDMDRAVERINRALGEKEPIMVYGDYDVDGTTSVALVYTLLSRYADRLYHYVPDRYTEGYGISFQGIDTAAAKGVKLIIALDCGIKALAQVAYAREKGIDFIICDHHLPGATLPEAVAVLDPKRGDCGYPYKELSGCGIGFKLMQGFARQNGIASAEVEELLDLVAISIGCDIVPVMGENRVLAHFGLKLLNETTPRPGIKALLGFSNHKRPLTITDLVFVLGPRINAAGRIEHGQQAVELLLAKDEKEADNIANLVNANNLERQVLDKAITDEALAMFTTEEHLKEAWSTVVYGPSWHKGVIGIVASRLIEKHYRPTVVLAESNGKVSGSARSVKGFNIHDALEACSDLLERHGGHMYAAGLTMEPGNVEAFRMRFEETVRATMDPALRIPEESIDLEIGLQQVRPSFFRALHGMEPFGPQNMKPVFLTRGLAAKNARLIGHDASHLKFTVQVPGQPELDVIAFGQGDRMGLVNSGQPFSMLYTVEENRWKDRVSLQLNMKDIKPGTEGLLVSEQERDLESTSA